MRTIVNHETSASREDVTPDGAADFERNGLQARVDLLVALQGEIVKLTVARTEAHIVTQLLRSARNPLGYARAIYFRVDRERGIEARARIDDSGDILPGGAFPNVHADAAILEALRRESMPAAGGASPLCELPPSYVLSPLRDGMRTVGILYVDERREPSAVEADPSFVHALTAVAAAALGNAERLARVTDLARLDPLTGLLNRRAMAECFVLELELCKRERSSLTYATIDVDDLKAVNDLRGHAQGDATLRGVAESLVRSSRSGDIVGRLGGDEFAVTLPGVDRELAGSLIARLSNALADAGLRCSIGAAVFPQDAADGASLMLRADRALYAAKAAGKERFSFA